MSRKWVRYARWSLAALAVGLLLSTLVGWLRFRARSGRVYALLLASWAIERTSAALARGEHFARGLAGCAECHGADFGGRVFVETCHGPDLRGGLVIHPGAPPSADISPAAVSHWEFASFERALREGRGRDGHVLDQAMPWRSTKNLSNDELRALWLALRQK